MEPAPRLLRTRAAARYCGLAKSILEKLRCYGGGPDFVRRGKAVFYPRECLEDWIAGLPRYIIGQNSFASWLMNSTRWRIN